MLPGFENCWTCAPGDAEARLAREALRVLAALLAERRVDQPVRLHADDGDEELILPVSAVRMLEALLRELAGWNAMALVPIYAELTTQRAAELLNVSRPTVARLLDSGAIRSRRVGRHRRVRLIDLMAYRQKVEPQRVKPAK
jgi:excisionase family DNA binding protein